MIRTRSLGLLITVFALAACEGPQGPAGPSGATGPQGPAGPRGPTGPAGADANENCTQCHTGDVEIYAKQVQFELSAHGPGMYMRASSSCATCHTHQGYLMRLEKDDLWEVDETIAEAAPVNCRTCHEIHTTYTDADYALTATDPVYFRVAATAVDLEGAGNLCARCHQSRPRSPFPVIDGAPVTFTSTHYGPHYSPQGDFVAGVGFFDFEGGNGGTHTHGEDAGCQTCHMTGGDHDEGGHTWVPTVAGCQECHDSAGDFDLFNGQTDVQELIDELAVLIEASGVGHFEDGEWHPVPGTYPANVVAARIKKPTPACTNPL